jgi:hypothetical protein
MSLEQHEGVLDKVDAARLEEAQEKVLERFHLRHWRVRPVVQDHVEHGRVRGVV